MDDGGTYFSIEKKGERGQGWFSATAASSLVDTKMRSGRGEVHMCIRECVCVCVKGGACEKTVCVCVCVSKNSSGISRCCCCEWARGGGRVQFYAQYAHTVAARTRSEADASSSSLSLMELIVSCAV